MAPPAGLYLHVPFCRRKCPYCDFYSVTDLTAVPSWRAALEADIALHREAGPAFDTLYVGGGTPTVLSEPDLDALLHLLRRSFPLTPNLEFTCEANPDDLSPRLLALLAAHGVNRLSLGVQSLNDPELALLGRRHRAAPTLRALEAARNSAIPGLSVDLIYALPGQTAASWLATLAAVLDFAPEHLSCYQLTVAAGTPFARLRAQGRLPAADDERQRRFFLLTSRFLTARGYLHYEVSNFARDDSHRCRHNLKYWEHVPYLGLGPAAHSFDGRRRRWNHPSLADYCAALETGGAPAAGAETLTPAQLTLEALFLGLRTAAGVPLESLRGYRNWDKIVTQLCQSGLATLVSGRLVPTPAGYLVADGLPLLFLENEREGNPGSAPGPPPPSHCRR